MTSFRRVLSWWAPAGVIALMAAIWVRAGGLPKFNRGWLTWVAILLVGITGSAAHSERKLSLLGMPLAWLSLYFTLLIVAIFLEVTAFFLPMRSIHALMGEQKTLFLAHADHLSSEIDRLQQLLCEQRTVSERQQIRNLTADLADTYKRAEKIPT